MNSFNFDCEKIHWDIALCQSCRKKFKSFDLRARKEFWDSLTYALDIDLQHAMEGREISLLFAKRANSIKE